MQYVRFRDEKGRPHPGILDDDDNALDMGPHFEDWNQDFILKRGHSEVQKVLEGERGNLRVVPNPKLIVPLIGMGKMIHVGMNFGKHVKEANLPMPTEIETFMRDPRLAIGPFDRVRRWPRDTTQFDFEIELMIIIKTLIDRELDEDFRLEDVIFAIAVCNDYSARDYQRRGITWNAGKQCPIPIGKLVTLDEIDDIQNLWMILTVNGEVRQNSNTSDMIFDVRQVLRDFSKWTILYPWDAISLGTPEGVGLKDDRWLEDGDEVELEIQGLGKQKQIIVPA